MDDFRLARAYLTRVADPPAPALTALIDEVGPVQAADMVSAANVPDAVAHETAQRRDQHFAEEDLAAAHDVGARLVCPEDDEWPVQALSPLRRAYASGFDWAAPPIGLWVRGDIALPDAVGRAVALVGSRAATAYGEHVASDTACQLALADVTIVSGGAFGIDAAAHRGALAARRPTVAILACGIDVAYPSAHAQMLGHIAAHGLLISQYPPRARPSRERFLTRNRLTAAMTDAVVVVEAGIRSGTRHTAAVAGVLGKPVLAVPGPITSATSRGCHALLRNGQATLIESATQVLAAVGSVTPSPLAHVFRDRVRAVYEALVLDAEIPEPDLSSRTGFDIGALRSALDCLALTRSAIQGDTGWRRS